MSQERGKKGKKRDRSDAAAGAVLALEEFGEEELQEAALLLEEETTYVRQAMGHTNTSLVCARPCCSFMFEPANMCATCRLACIQMCFYQPLGSRLTCLCAASLETAALPSDHVLVPCTTNIGGLVWLPFIHLELKGCFVTG